MSSMHISYLMEHDSTWKNTLSTTCALCLCLRQIHIVWVMKWCICQERQWCWMVVWCIWRCWRAPQHQGLNHHAASRFSLHKMQQFRWEILGKVSHGMESSQTTWMKCRRFCNYSMVCSVYFNCIYVICSSVFEVWSARTAFNLLFLNLDA